MPGGEVLRAAAASSLGHEDDNHDEPVEPKESDNKHILNCSCKGWG